MQPPLFQTVAADGTVQSVFGTNPVRVFPFGGAPEGVARPYAVWQIIGGTPENYLGNSPDLDTYLVQVDVYADTVTSAQNGAEALRDALEPLANIVSWRGGSRDNSTQHFRYSFDINFLTAR